MKLRFDSSPPKRLLAVQDNLVESSFPSESPQEELIELVTLWLQAKSYERACRPPLYMTPSQWKEPEYRKSTPFYNIMNRTIFEEIVSYGLADFVISKCNIKALVKPKQPISDALADCLEDTLGTNGGNYRPSLVSMIKEATKTLTITRDKDVEGVVDFFWECLTPEGANRKWVCLTPAHTNDSGLLEVIFLYVYLSEGQLNWRDLFSEQHDSPVSTSVNIIGLQFHWDKWEGEAGERIRKGLNAFRAFNINENVRRADLQ
jgi:hypothetical protein